MSKLKRRLANMHKSLTCLFNGFIGSAVLLLPVAQENLPQLQEYVDAGMYKTAMGVLIVGNIILRFKTTCDLAHKE
jgi:hypothetical protein